jgi:hypothetical protein
MRQNPWAINLNLEVVITLNVASLLQRVIIISQQNLVAYSDILYPLRINYKNIPLYRSPEHFLFS